MRMLKLSVDPLQGVTEEKRVSYHRYGKEYTRAYPKQYRDAATPVQMLQRNRFHANIAFYANLKTTILSVAWKIAAREAACSGYNLFMHRNMNVFDRAGGIKDFTKLILVEGEQQLPDHLGMEVSSSGKVQLQWTDNSGQSTARMSDRLAVAVIYDDAPFEVFFQSTGDAIRLDEFATFTLERPLADGAHLYAFFHTADYSAFSPQRYFRISTNTSLQH